MRFRLGPAGFAETCGWQIKIDKTSLLVRTKESYDGVAPGLVSARLVADAANHGLPRFVEAAGLVAHGDLGGLPPEISIPESIATPQTREDAWAAFRFGVTTASDSELGPFLKRSFDRFLQELPNAQLWLVEAHPRISWRAAAVRALFAAEEQPEILERDEGAFDGLPPPHQLMQSLGVGLAAFVDPMVMTMSPWLIGMSAARIGGSFVLLFGRSEPGFIDSQAPELLNLLRPSWASQPSRPTHRPEVPPSDAAGVARFWCGRLNDVLSLALDPVNFKDRAGDYSPRDHLGVLLSLERLFSSVQGILAHADRDPYARQLFFFSVMDQLVGLGFDSWSNLLSPRKVRAQLQQLEAVLPPGVREIVLWRCRAAVDALEALRDGLGPVERVQGTMIRVRTDAGGWGQLSIDEAVARYLNVIRNSTHSFREMARTPRHLSILASEREVPANALADLGLFHLLRFMEKPLIRI